MKMVWKHTERCTVLAKLSKTRTYYIISKEILCYLVCYSSIV